MEEEIVGEPNWLIGLTDQGHEGRWIWQHSYDPARNFHWATNYPKSADGGDDCIIMDMDYVYLWTDHRYTPPLHFLKNSLSCI